MNRKIVITGATGLIGKRIAGKLIQRGDLVTIFTRSADKARRIIPGAAEYVEWNYKKQDWQIYIEGIDAVIHLAGENVMAKHWNKEHKANILNSRVESTFSLVNAVGHAVIKPKVFISASATGYYGNSEQPATEVSLPGKDFLADVVSAWEAETKKIDAYKIRRVNIRTGIVLDKNGGALARMITPFKYFIGGPLGNGKQWFPWIHIDDVVGIFLHALDNENVEGAVNCVSPNPVTMNQFAETIGKTIKRPSSLRIPEFLLRFILGESSSVVIGGLKVSSSKIISCGYKFKYSYIEEALNNLL